MSNDMAGTSPTMGAELLSPWNPLDLLRLLGWVFLWPDRLAAYREQAGEVGLRRVGAALVRSPDQESV